jgi:hypothetical protein
MNQRLPSDPDTGPEPGLRRRGVLLSVPALLLAAALPLPACTPRAARPGAAPAGSAAPGSLPAFLRLSALLTGFDRLSEEEGTLYLRSLLADPVHAGALAALYDKARFLSADAPTTLEALTATGVFEDARLRATADALTLCWYSGIHETGGGPAVATFTEALGWQSLEYTQAPTVCGGPMGFWAEPPRS